jgi:uncharacterized RDD family membrane protein YckC
MQCVRCSQPLTPRADRCLRCFTLNPQNRPEPLVAKPSPELRAPVVEQPLALSIESDPPRLSAALGALSIHSEPPLIAAKACDTDPQFGHAIDLIAQMPIAATPRQEPLIEPIVAPLISPDAPTTEPLFGQRIAMLAVDTEPVFTQPTPSSLPRLREQYAGEPIVIERLPATPQAAARKIDALAQTALLLSNVDLPIDPAWRSAPPPMHTAAIARPAPTRNIAHDSMPEPTMSQAAAPRAPSLLVAQIKAWAIDAAAIALTSTLFIAISVLLLGEKRLAPLGTQSWQSWADGLLFTHHLPLLWCLLTATLALGYSWLFTALMGRTLGLRTMGLTLKRVDGSRVDPVRSLARAALALPSAALGLFGFVLALLDPRGQTLHDKLVRTLVVSDGSHREST